MTELHDTPSELFLRFYRRSMCLLLVLIVSLGATLISTAVWPESDVSRVLMRASWAITVAIAISVAVLRTSLRGHRWTPDNPEVQAIMRDELRRTSMERACRGALIVVLSAQVPFGLLLMSLPARQAVIGMAASTVTLGMAAVVTLFLVFDRE